MKYFFALAVLLLWAAGLNAAPTESTVELKTETGTLEGTLLVPPEIQKPPVALIIAGSGPTDRDGNNAAMKCNALKMLAVALHENGIATLRYDKRGLGQSSQAAIPESDLRFENFIEDVKGWIALLGNDERFGSLIVIGHSQGSLLGMIASQDFDVDLFISIAGLGQSVDLTLKDQLAAQPPDILEMSFPIIDQLALGNTVDDVPPILNPLFRPSIQPFLISYMAYDPQKEIAKLSPPVMIIQGSTDIQVTEKDARLLAEAHPGARLRIIEGMNHVLKEAPIERTANIETYDQPDLPLVPELVLEIVDFVGEEGQAHD